MFDRKKAPFGAFFIVLPAWKNAMGMNSYRDR
jgi:hypothetical protein